MKSNEALAMHLGWDVSELKDYRYQPGRTSKAVYAIGNDYMCATKGKDKPATHEGIDFQWKEVPDNHLNPLGFKIWLAKPSFE